MRMLNNIWMFDRFKERKEPKAVRHDVAQQKCKIYQRSQSSKLRPNQVPAWQRRAPPYCLPPDSSSSATLRILKSPATYNRLSEIRTLSQPRSCSAWTQVAGTPLAKTRGLRERCVVVFNLCAHRRKALPKTATWWSRECRRLNSRRATASSSLTTSRNSKSPRNHRPEKSLKHRGMARKKHSFCLSSTTCWRKSNQVL